MKTPDLLVEKLALGELSEPEAKRVRERLQAEEGGLDRLVAIERANAAALESYPPARAAKDIDDKLRIARAREQDARRRAPAFIGLSVAAAATAALLVVVVPRGAGQIVEAAADEVRTKGIEPRLAVYRERAGGPEGLRPGDVVVAGDVLQLAYVAGGRAFGAIVSLDGAGQVTTHLPEAGESAVALERAGLVRLAHAYRLDDAPRFERFFFVAADEPFAVDDVRAAVARLAADPGSAPTAPPSLPPGAAVTSFFVAKSGER